MPHSVLLSSPLTQPSSLPSSSNLSLSIACLYQFPPSSHLLGLRANRLRRPLFWQHLVLLNHSLPPLTETEPNLMSSSKPTRFSSVSSAGPLSGPYAGPSTSLPSKAPSVPAAPTSYGSSSSPLTQPSPMPSSKPSLSSGPPTDPLSEPSTGPSSSPICSTAQCLGSA